MTEKLIQLPNGSWVLPSAVTSVRVAEKCMGLGARVLVTHGAVNEVILAADFAEAQAIAARVANALNNRRASQ